MRKIGFENMYAPDAETPAPENIDGINNAKASFELPLAIKAEIRDELTNKLTKLLGQLHLQREALEYIEHREKFRVGITQRKEVPMPRNWQPGVFDLAKKFEAPGVAEAMMQKTQAEIEETQGLLSDLATGSNYENISFFLESYKTEEEIKIDTEIKKLQNTKTETLGILGPTPGSMKKRIDKEEQERLKATTKRRTWIEELRGKK